MMRLSSNAATIQDLLDDIAEEVGHRMNLIYHLVQDGSLDVKTAMFASGQLHVLMNDISNLEYGPIAASERVSKPLSDQELWERANPGQPYHG